MTLKELKTQIENGIPPIGCLVFFCEEYENSSMNLFIPHQYIDAIAKLKPQQQWIVKQVFIYGRKQCEVASDLKISEPALSQRIAVIKVQIKKFLKNF